MLRFRPHHFLCTLGFEGKGYSPGFVENFTKIAETLRDGALGDQTPIETVADTDSICQPCPNRTGTTCTSELKIRALDNAHAALTHLTPGKIVTWGIAKKTMAEKISIEDFHRACAPCSWRSLGVCEAALKKLKNDDSREKDRP